MSVDYSKLKMVDLAELIQRRLKEWEKDPTINRSANGGEKFICPNVALTKTQFHITYSHGQVPRVMTKREAVLYLQLIDGGYRGRFIRSEAKMVA